MRDRSFNMYDCTATIVQTNVVIQVVIHYLPTFITILPHTHTVNTQSPGEKEVLFLVHLTLCRRSGHLPSNIYIPNSALLFLQGGLT